MPAARGCASARRRRRPAAGRAMRLAIRRAVTSTPFARHVSKCGDRGRRQVDSRASLRLVDQRIDQEPVLDHVRERLAGSTSPANVRNTGRTASSSLESVTTMSRIGCASPATALPHADRLEQSPRRRGDGRGARVLDGSRPAPDRRPSTANDRPSAWRSAIASARPAKPPPPISMSTRSLMRLCHGCILADGCCSIPAAALWLDHHGTRAMSVRRPGAARHSRPRAARGEPVPRPLAAIALAAGVRRPGDRPGAGRRLPHGRDGARRRIRCTPISCSPAIPRCRSSTRSTASATARASPPAASSRSSTATRSSPCRCRSTCDEPGLDASGQMPDVPQPDELPSEAEIRKKILPHDARAGAALLRARAADRAAPGRIRPLSRQERSETAASTSGSARPAQLPDDPAIHQCVLAYASDMTLLDARPRPARPHRVRARTSWRRASTMRSGFIGRSAPTNGCSMRRTARTCRRARLLARPDLRPRRHSGRLGRAGRAGAASDD